MALTVSEPASLFDMADLGGAATRLHWAVVKEMWRGGETMSIRHGEQLIGVFGLYPIDGGAEAWFNVSPGAAPRMLDIVRLIRLTIISRRYPEIVVLCTSKAGSRIARLCGFHFVESVENGEIWHAEFAREQQGRGPCETAGGAAAAPNAGRAGTPTG